MLSYLARLVCLNLKPHNYLGDATGDQIRRLNLDHAARLNDRFRAQGCSHGTHPFEADCSTISRNCEAQPLGSSQFEQLRRPRMTAYSFIGYFIASLIRFIFSQSSISLTSGRFIISSSIATAWS